MKTLGNIIWLVLAGIWMAAAYVLAGVVMFITIIGIPLGVQAFKLAGFALWPFGRTVIRNPRSDIALSTIANVLWFIFCGIWLAIGHVITGVLLMITIIGIPFGVASFKMAGLALVPFGKTVVRAKDVGDAQVVVAIG